MNTFQGRSLTPLFKTGEHQDFKNRSLYYAFYANPGEHNAPRHDGLRTDRYTLSYIWTSDEWMLFDNQKDCLLYTSGRQQHLRTRSAGGNPGQRGAGPGRPERGNERLPACLLYTSRCV